MLKVLVYGYLTNQYSSRKIEQALQQNIHFMWLSGMSYPDHNTINRFRSDRLKGVLKEVFNQVVMLLVDHGHITLKEAYLDGTKIEANAIKYNRERIKGQLQDLWSYAEEVAKEEMEHNEPESFEEIDTEKVTQAIANERLNSDLGKHYRSKRPVEVEPVFGMIKSNRKYRRFLLRGMEKVEIEAGLFALAHNLKKMAN